MERRELDHHNGYVSIMEREDGNSLDFDHRTTPEVRKILQRECDDHMTHRHYAAPVRLFFGDSVTGEDWGEENDVYGYVGRSTGDFHIPLLIAKGNSLGGPAILDYCIVKVMKGKVTLWQHPLYHMKGDYSLQKADSELQGMGYTVSVFQNKENVANFKTAKQAVAYVEFMKGNRHTKGGNISRKIAAQYKITDSE